MENFRKRGRGRAAHVARLIFLQRKNQRRICQPVERFLPANIHQIVSYYAHPSPDRRKITYIMKLPPSFTLRFDFENGAAERNDSTLDGVRRMVVYRHWKYSSNRLRGSWINATGRLLDPFLSSRTGFPMR